MRIEHVIKQDRIDRSIQNQAILYKGEAYTYFDSGNTRHVFVNPDKTKVIKILINKHFKEYNLEEVQIYKNAKPADRELMAVTEIQYNGHVVEQEFCNPIKLDDRKLTIAQALFAGKCRNEVGWNKEGKLVCFDLDEYKKY